MQTQLTSEVKQTRWAQDAEHILRACVHCGFCTAVCPTYQLLGNELDSPRGRIYLIKSMLEGNVVSRETQRHLDRCLTCRACESACPSGVRYGQLIDLGRDYGEQLIRRPVRQQLSRWLLRTLLPSRRRFATLFALGQPLRAFLPQPLKNQIPQNNQVRWHYPQQAHPRKMILLEGCVEPTLTPNAQRAAALVLDRLGIELLRLPQAGCCGAVNQHLGAPTTAAKQMRQNIDAWWSHIESGAEAIITTASGCGVMLKEYAEVLKQDTDYALKAEKISRLSRDIGEIIAPADLDKLALCPLESTQRLAIHTPCSLQHGQGLPNLLEPLLTRLGYELTPVNDKHLCCGAAGTYALLQPALAEQLKNNKLTALQQGQPDCIVTANVGCQVHLDADAHVPVKHWIELIAERLPART